MSLVVDIIIVALLALGGYLGWKAGILKTLVRFVGLVAITILAFTFKSYLAKFLLGIIPFSDFGGIFEGIYSINIFLCNGIAFLVIFILLYCLLNIIISVTGFIDTLLKFTVIWILPSKILGSVVGVLEGWVFVLVALVGLSQFTFTTNMVYESNIAPVMMKYTPVVGKLARGTAESMNDVYKILKEAPKDTDRSNLDLRVLQEAISAGIITTGEATELIDTGKLPFENVLFG